MIYTDEMLDAARGVMQLLRGKPGVTFSELRKHCIARGDDMHRWPDWALAEEGYVTEASATMLVYEIIDRFAPPEETRIEEFAEKLRNLHKYDCHGPEGDYSAGMEPGSDYVSAYDLARLIEEYDPPQPQSRSEPK